MGFCHVAGRIQKSGLDMSRSFILFSRKALFLRGHDFQAADLELYWAFIDPIALIYIGLILMLWLICFPLTLLLENFFFLFPNFVLEMKQFALHFCTREGHHDIRRKLDISTICYLLKKTLIFTGTSV